MRLLYLWSESSRTLDKSLLPWRHLARFHTLFVHHALASNCITVSGIDQSMTKAAQSTRKDSADSRAEGKSPNVVPIRPDSDIDPLANFGVEGAAVVAVATPPRSVLSKKLLSGIAAGVGVPVAAVAGIVYARQRTNQPPVAAPPVLEHALLNSRPDGAAVVVDGVARGVTPLDVTLAVGAHDVLFRNDAGER